MWNVHKTNPHNAKAHNANVHNAPTVCRERGAATPSPDDQQVRGADQQLTQFLINLRFDMFLILIFKFLKNG